MLWSGFILSACASDTAQKAIPAPTLAFVTQASPSPSVVPGSGVSLDASQKIEFPVTPSEKKKLAKDFKSALSEELNVFDRQEKQSTKTLALNQSLHAKAWREQERKARRIYFTEHTSGPERRQYVQDYQKRLKQFDQSLKDEAVSEKNSWKQKRELLKASQKNRDSQFKAALDQNKHPQDSLWPQVR